VFKEDFICGIKFDTFGIMKKFHFISILCFSSLSSCFIADSIFLDLEPKKESLDSKIEKEITSYILKNSEDYIYKNYGFSELIIKKPAEMVVLDELKRKQTLDSTQIQINQQIETLDSIIKVKNIRYTLEMDHVYSLKNKLTNITELFETKFTLADSINVTSLKPLLNLKLSEEDLVIFENYFYEFPIFVSGHYSESKALSIEFYNYFKQHQDQLIGVKQKSNFLAHTIKLCKDVKVDGVFDQTYFLLKLADNKIRSDSTISNYKSIEYSPLFETIIDETLVNYYFFHRFINSNNNTLDTSSVYVEFSPYYELKSISTPGKTYNYYFND